MKTAIISFAAFSVADEKKRLGALLTDEHLAEAVALTPAGKNFLAYEPDGKSLHIFSPLDNTFKKALFTKECPPLYDLDYTYQWIISLLKDMGENSAVYIEIPNIKTNAANGKITPESLKGVFYNVKKYKDDWYEITFDDAKKTKRTLKTAQAFFHALFPSFCEALRDIQQFKQGYSSEEILTEAARCFKYGLYAGMQKVFLTKRTLEKENVPYQQLSLLDVGGGYGFVAIEMAAMGHTVKVIDIFPGYLNVAKHLAKLAGVDEKISFELCDMAELENPSDCFDVVTFFGSLLYVPRESTAKVISNSMKCLKTGGILLLHENTKAVIKATEKDYQTCFDPLELKDYLVKNAGQPRFYNVFNGTEMSWFFAKSRVIAAAVKKVA